MHKTDYGMFVTSPDLCHLLLQVWAASSVAGLGLERDPQGHLVSQQWEQMTQASHFLPDLDQGPVHCEEARLGLPGCHFCRGPPG